MNDLTCYELQTLECYVLGSRVLPENPRSHHSHHHANEDDCHENRGLDHSLAMEVPVDTELSLRL